MSIDLLRGCAAATATGLLASGCAAAPAAPAGQAPATRARVGLVEWGFTTSASAFGPERVELAVTNAGATPHDMQVLVGDRVVAHTEVLAPGERQTVRAALAGASQVRLLCTLPGHAAHGMVQEVPVAPPTTHEERQDP